MYKLYVHIISFYQNMFDRKSVKLHQYKNVPICYFCTIDVLKVLATTRSAFCQKLQDIRAFYI